MFMLYAIPIGVAAGWLTGGRASRLGEMSFRWAPLALIGLLVQVVLFFGPVAERVGALGTPVYLASTVLVLAVVLRNVRTSGLPLVAAGATANLLAIVANGGYMPASAAALSVLDKGINAGYSNSAIADDPALWILTDLFALPPQLPFANVFSVGDVLIGVGVAWAIAAAMRVGGASGNMGLKYAHAGTDER